MDYKDKIEHLKKLGFKGDMTQLYNYYQGKPVVSSDSNFKKLISMSKKLCNELSLIYKELNRNKETNKYNDLIERKNEIIDILFPGHGFIGNICDGLKVVIGQVDLTGISGINANVTFTPYTLVHFGDYAMVGANIQFGNIKKGKELQTIGKINFGDDNWICSGVKIASNINIGNRNVIAMGACVKSNLGNDGLFLGNPAKRKLTITHDYKGNKNNSTNRSEEEINFLINHLHSLGFTGDFTEYIKLLKGENYNTMQETIGQIIEFSHNLSYEFNNPQTTKERKKEIINILFPIRGKNTVIKKGLFVDVLGCAKLGNNVKIEKNAFFAGNITIGDNVTIGENACMSAIGHELYYKIRHLDYNPNDYGEITVPGKIIIKDNITIGNNCKFVPGCQIDKNIPDNSLILTNGKINQLETFDNIEL